jgi:hypothetical protein
MLTALKYVRILLLQDKVLTLVIHTLVSDILPRTMAVYVDYNDVD